MIESSRICDEIIYTLYFIFVKCFDSTSSDATDILTKNLESLSSLTSLHCQCGFQCDCVIIVLVFYAKFVLQHKHIVLELTSRLTRRDHEVIEYKHTHVRNNSKLTNFKK